MRVDLHAVFRPGVFRRHFQAALVFHIEQQHRLAELRLDLLRIQHVQQDHFVAPEPQRLYRLDDRLRLLVKIGKNDHDAAPVQELLKVHKWLGEIGVSADFRFFDPVQQAEQLPLPRGGSDIVLHVLVKDDESGSVALVRRHVAETGRHEAGEVELVHRVRAVAHRSAGVEQDQQLRIGLAAIAFEVHALRAGEDVPIDVAQVVAGRVGAVFGEFLAEAEIRRAVQSGHEAIHHGLGDQVETVDGSERSWIEKSLQHKRYLLLSTDSQSTPPKPPDQSTGPKPPDQCTRPMHQTKATGPKHRTKATGPKATVAQALQPAASRLVSMRCSRRRLVSSSRFNKSSCFNRSDSAWKFSKIRCRRMGTYSARISSYVT